jgi:hypothetical protein
MDKLRWINAKILKGYGAYIQGISNSRKVGNCSQKRLNIRCYGKNEENIVSLNALTQCQRKFLHGNPQFYSRKYFIAVQ